MNRKAFARIFADKYDITQDLAKQMCYSVFETLNEQLLQGEDVYIFNFGTFKHKTKKAKTVRHPKTGELMVIPEKTVITFVKSNNKSDDDEE